MEKREGVHRIMESKVLDGQGKFSWVIEEDPQMLLFEIAREGDQKKAGRRRSGGAGRRRRIWADRLLDRLLAVGKKAGIEEWYGVGVLDYEFDCRVLEILNRPDESRKPAEVRLDRALRRALVQALSLRGRPKGASAVSAVGRAILSMMPVEWVNPRFLKSHPLAGD